MKAWPQGLKGNVAPFSWCAGRRGGGRKEVRRVHDNTGQESVLVKYLPKAVSGFLHCIALLMKPPVLIEQGWCGDSVLLYMCSMHM